MIASKDNAHITEMQTGERMKVKIEIDHGLPEEEIIIRCRQLDERVVQIQTAIASIAAGDRCITLKKGETSYFIPFQEILFFETEGKTVQAHTSRLLLTTEYKLYELEELLPGFFMRISKSTIVNLRHVYSVTRNLTASSVVEFHGSCKKVYVSRNYYKALIERLEEKRTKL